MMQVAEIEMTTRSLKYSIISNNFEALNKQRKEGVFCDLIILCKDNQEMKAHKSVLYSASKYFKDMFTSGMKETTADSIELESVSSDILEVLLSFIYQREFNVTAAEEIENIICHADFFQLTKLVEICQILLIKFIDKNRCMKYWKLANELSLKQLENSCIGFILNAGLKLFSTYSFTEDQMKTLLTDDRLVGSNEEIFESVLNWAENNSDGKIKKLLKLLSEVADYIHFPLNKMPSLLCKIISNNEDLLEDKKLLKSILNSERYTTCHVLRPSLLVSSNGMYRADFLKKGFVTLHGRKISKVSSTNGTLQDLQCKFSQATNFGYTTFGNNLLFLCGGISKCGYPTNSCEYFSMFTKEWKELPKLLHARKDHACAVVDNKLYICGGNNAVNNEIFDLDTGELIEDTSSNLKCFKGRFGLASLNRALYAVGGNSDNNISMFDFRTSAGLLNIAKFDGNPNVRCTPIGSEIYCHSESHRWFFDTRNYTQRLWIKNEIVDSCPWESFDVCELNGEIGYISNRIFGNMEYNNFFKYNLNGEKTLAMGKSNSEMEMICGTALVSLYY